MAYYAQPSAESALVLRNSAETLSVTFYSGTTAADVSTGSVTIGIVDEAGNTVVSSGTAVTAVGSGVYTYSLASQSDLKRLIATWTGTWGSAMTFDTYHEVVGNFLTTPNEVRALDGISGETSAYPNSAIVEAIEYAESIITDYCGASFVQRYHRDVLNGTDTESIKLSKMFPQKLLSASVDGTALTAAELSDVALFDDGFITRGEGLWTFTDPGSQVIIEFEHGASSNAPADIRWAAKVIAKWHLQEQLSRLPDNAISVQSEVGQIQLSQPGMNRPTPLPAVNTVLNRHRHRAPSAF